MTSAEKTRVVAHQVALSDPDNAWFLKCSPSSRQSRLEEIAETGVTALEENEGIEGPWNAWEAWYYARQLGFLDE